MPAWRDVPFHPVAVATLPVLTLYAANQDEVFPSQLFAPLALALAGTLAVWLLLALVARDVRRPAMTASFLAFLFFSYGPVVRWTDTLRLRRGWAVEIEHVDLVWSVLALAAVALAWVAKGDTRKPTRILNVATAAMLVLPLASVVAYQAEDAVPARPEGATSGPTALDYAPNVYVLMLDGYAHPETLKDRFGFDDASFLHGLAARGFYVVPESRANYAQTYLSVPSMLHADYIPHEDATAATMDRALAYGRGSTLETAARANGYRYVVFASGWGVTSNDASADWVRTCGRMGEFEFSLLQNTPLLRADGWMSDAHRERIECQFRDLGEMPSLKGPFVVFAHVVSPHWPYVFHADGSPVDPALEAADGVIDPTDPEQVAQKRDLYVGQVQYVNTKTLAVVDEILAGEAKPPVIVILSDHGSDLEAGEEWPSGDPVWYQERLRNLEAVYFPGAEDALYPTMTPINVFRALLTEYFGADLPPVEDRSWYSAPGHPATLADVTEDAAW